jgi:hypothetical protein
MQRTDKTMTETSEPARPWWREPWPWLLMAGPALAVVGCIITIVLAFMNIDLPVKDGGIKQGLVVSKQADAQAAAPQR